MTLPSPPPGGLPLTYPAARADIHSVGGTKSSLSANSPQLAKLTKAAGEFESILLESLWKSMKETFADSGDADSDPTLKSFDDWGIQAMAGAVGSSGGLGFKNMIIRYLAPALASGEVRAAPSSSND
jgi:Rod binding domain-containing protein